MCAATANGLAREMSHRLCDYCTVIARISVSRPKLKRKRSARMFIVQLWTKNNHFRFFLDDFQDQRCLHCIHHWKICRCTKWLSPKRMPRWKPHTNPALPTAKMAIHIWPRVQRDNRMPSQRSIRAWVTSWDWNYRKTLLHWICQNTCKAVRR